MTPPATIPIAGLETSATTTATAGADDRGHELAPAGDEPDGQADHRGREDDVDAETAGSGIWAPSRTPASVATFHGMNVEPIAASQ